MSRRQKAILIELITVIVITAIAVIAITNFRDWLNRSETIQAMEQLGKIVLKYRQTHGSIPSEGYVSSVKEQWQGRIRLDKLHYRALWINSESPPNEILAYTEKNYRSLFVGKGYAVLRLDGRVEWMEKQQFETLLAQQQSSTEKQAIDY